MFQSELTSYNSVNQQETQSFKRTMKYAPEYKVIFSLTLEDPSKQNAHWNIEGAMEGIVYWFTCFTF